MELIDSDFGNSHSFYEKLEDFDSGCSCIPSSPSNCSDFSCSSLDNFGDDWTIRKDVAMEMGQSFLDGGPVLNPYITIKSENDSVEFEKPALLMPDNFPDLLDNTGPSCTQLQLHQCLTDLNVNEVHPSLTDILSDKSLYDTAINIAQPNTEQKCQPECKVKQQARKRNYSEFDHTYANNKDNQSENIVAQKPKSNSNSNNPKDYKYWEKRQKNNLAAKRSREMKRSREIELLKKSSLLEKENADLLKQMKKLKNIVSKLELKLKR